MRVARKTPANNADNNGDVGASPYADLQHRLHAMTCPAPGGLVGLCTERAAISKVLPRECAGLLALTCDCDLVSWLACVHVCVKGVHQQAAGCLTLRDV